MRRAIVERAAQIALVATALSVCVGCRTTEASKALAHEAVFSKAHHAYIIEPESSDAPGPARSSVVYVLRHPIDGHKLSCQEEVAPYAGPIAEALARRVHDDAWGHNSFGMMAPFSIVAAVGVGATAAVGTVLVVAPAAATRVPYWIAKNPSASSEFDSAMDEFRARDYAGAAHRLERLAFAGELSADRMGWLPYYLALSYEQLHDEKRAVEAFVAFASQSSVVSERAYEETEFRLARLRAPLTPCGSRAPVPLHYPSE